jgi:hypothetical protein
LRILLYVIINRNYCRQMKTPPIIFHVIEMNFVFISLAYLFSSYVCIKVHIFRGHNVRRIHCIYISSISINMMQNIPFQGFTFLCECNVYLLLLRLFTYLSDCFNPDLKTTLLSHLRPGKKNDGVDSGDINSLCLEQYSGGANITVPFSSRPKCFECCRKYSSSNNYHFQCCTFFFCSLFPMFFFYLFACLTCFAIIGNNELVSCPKFCCRVEVCPLSALEQHALRFAVIDYNIRF